MKHQNTFWEMLSPGHSATDAIVTRYSLLAFLSWLTWTSKKRQHTLPFPQTWGQDFSSGEISLNLNSEFQWSKLLPPLPQPASFWERFPLKRKSTVSCPNSSLVKWAFDLLNWGSVFGIFPGQRKNSSQKRFFVFEQCTSRKIKKQTQSDFRNLIFYSILYIRSKGSTLFLKMNQNPVQEK